MTFDLFSLDRARTARDLSLIDAVARVLRLASGRLEDLAPRARATASAASWSAPSARAFGESADELSRAVASAQILAEDAVVAAARARAEVGGRVRP